MKTREDTKFKKIKAINLSHNLFQEVGDIYIKAWDCFKHVRDFFPQRALKPLDLRRVSNESAGKIFASAVGNIKEIQDLIETIDRIIIIDKKEKKDTKM